MESVTLNGRWWNRIALPLAPRQRVGAWLGKLDEAGRLGVQRAADVARKSIEPVSAAERMQLLGRQMRFEFDDNVAAAEPRWVEVNAGGTRNWQNARQEFSRCETVFSEGYDA